VPLMPDSMTTVFSRSTSLDSMCLGFFQSACLPGGSQLQSHMLAVHAH
jgi:hypothetical protein